MFRNYPALALNADFRPISIFPLSLWCWEDAVRAVFLDKVAVVEEYDVEIHAPSRTMRLPSVIALRDYVRPPVRAAFNRSNVFLRDRYRCLYCDERFERSDLTFDHVVPRVDGGQTCWTNIATACIDCNAKKGRLHLKPLRMPYEPTQHDLIAAQRMFPPATVHESWQSYLYWHVELEK